LQIEDWPARWFELSSILHSPFFILQSEIFSSSVILTTVLIKILYVVLVVSTVALLWVAAACYVRVRRHLAAKHEGLAGGGLAGGGEEERHPRQTVRGD
jgi:hypothetical protein